MSYYNITMSLDGDLFCIHPTSLWYGIEPDKLSLGYWMQNQITNHNAYLCASCVVYDESPDDAVEKLRSLIPQYRNMTN